MGSLLYLKKIEFISLKNNAWIYIFKSKLQKNFLYQKHYHKEKIQNFT